MSKLGYAARQNRGRFFLAIAIAFIILVAGALLYAKGQPVLCTCGSIKVWFGSPKGAENSQQLTDWYTFSHIIHGFLLYAVWAFSRRAGLTLSFGVALAAATALEAGWELFENSEFIITRYRSATVSIDYHGDSVINSIMDILAMVLGFVLASRLPVWAIIGAALAMEISIGLIIRDNLTLNVIMLMHPFEPIRLWQGGA